MPADCPVDPGAGNPVEWVAKRLGWTFPSRLQDLWGTRVEVGQGLGSTATLYKSDSLIKNASFGLFDPGNFVRIFFYEDNFSCIPQKILTF